MNSKPHSLEDYDLELQSLRGAILAMGRIALGMVDQIGNFIRNNEKPDKDGAKSSERDLDDYEAEVDEQARTIIIRYQPVATDLREVTGAVRMATDLEQIGDDAKRVLVSEKRLRAWIVGDAETVLDNLWHMSQRALREAYDAFVEHDAQKAGGVSQMKREIRKSAEAARRQVAQDVARDKELAPAFVEAVSAAHFLERIGLHACSLAEAVHFIEKATRPTDRGN